LRKKAGEIKRTTKDTEQRSFLPLTERQTKNIKKRKAVKGNAKKLHSNRHVETVVIFLQSPCRISDKGHK